MPAPTTPAAIIFSYVDMPHEIPQCPATEPAVFFAHSIGGGPTPVASAPFTTDDERFHGKRFGAREWLYYPVNFSKALHDVGVSNIVHCHSGRVVRDGVYQD